MELHRSFLGSFYFGIIKESVFLRYGIEKKCAGFFF